MILSIDSVILKPTVYKVWHLGTYLMSNFSILYFVAVVGILKPSGIRTSGQN